MFEQQNDFQSPLIEHRFYYLGKDATDDFPEAQRLKQIHSADCFITQQNFDEEKQGDGLVTSQPGFAIYVETADCVPVLFSGVNDDGPVVAACHAGWRGAFAGVVENAVAAMQAQNIKACIGPCIRQENYEVSAEFYTQFINHSRDNDKFFVPSERKGHKMFDLPAYVTMRLLAAGVKDVYDINHNTYGLPQKYSSYRRASHQKSKYNGGQYSLIMIKT
jgi:hypothetical protein